MTESRAHGRSVRRFLPDSGSRGASEEPLPAYPSPRLDAGADGSGRSAQASFERHAEALHAAIESLPAHAELRSRARHDALGAAKSLFDEDPLVLFALAARRGGGGLRRDGPGRLGRGRRRDALDHGR